MTSQTPRWQDLEEEGLRPLETAKRWDLHLTWVEWPGGHRRKKTPAGLTNEELDYWARQLLEELARRSEGRLAAARLLARFDDGKEGAV
jgi:hypothetical protein